MKRMLIVGCSHSMGQHRVYKNDKGDEVELTKDRDGWYNYIDDYIIDVYSMSGAGYINFSHWFQTAIEIEKYDIVLIQETQEPRLLITNEVSFWQQKPQRHITHNCITDKWKVANFSFYPEHDILCRRLLRNHGIDWNDNQLSYHEAVGKSDLKMYMINSCMSHINYLLQKENIPSFAIPYDETFIDLCGDNHFYCKYLKMDPFRHTFKDRSLVNTWFDDELKQTRYGHFNEKGNEVFGNIVNEALRKI